jgi:Na+-transporting NADH:ubiquinone oxidoreductase subunit NqrC
MLKTSFIIAAAMCGSVLVGSIVAIANPVTDADLRGKKICWNNGAAGSYNKDGSYDSNRIGHGTWRLAGAQLTVIGSNGSVSNTITKDGSKFHEVARGSRSGKDIEVWGDYCN